MILFIIRSVIGLNILRSHNLGIKSKNEIVCMLIDHQQSSLQIYNKLAKCGLSRLDHLFIELERKQLPSSLHAILQVQHVNFTFSQIHHLPEQSRQLGDHERNFSCISKYNG